MTKSQNLTNGMVPERNLKLTDSTPWSFKEEILAYCEDDVEILRQICLKYHETNVERFGISPWRSITAPGFCHKVIKRQISSDEYLNMPPDTIENDLARRARLKELSMNEHWAVLEEEEYWFARRALRGGRTDVRRITYTLSQEEIDQGVKIVYVDVNSMYPYVQVNYDYPVGVPQVYVYDRDYYPCHEHRKPDAGNVINLNCGCPYALRVAYKCRMMFIHVEDSEPTAESILADEDFFGIVCISYTPPKNLFHPILLTTGETGKCLATLEPQVGYVCTTVELKVALQNGYVLHRVHRFDKYKKRPGLWTDFIKQLYVDKLSYSQTAPRSREYMEETASIYEERFGMGDMIRESYPRWQNNPVKKQVAKIMLNSGWGKHCQRANMPTTELIGYEDLDASATFMQGYEDHQFNIIGIYHLEDKVAYEKSPIKNAYHNFHNSYIPAGLFVPAYGRLMLYEQLKHLGKNVLYHDTDSIIAIQHPDGYHVPTSDIWGDQEEEKDSKIGIVSFTSIAPKSYGYRLSNGKTVTKFKGVCLKASHSDILNFDIMNRMVNMHLGGEQLVVDVPQMGMPFSKKTLETRTTNALKQVKFDAETLKGNLHTDGYVYPFGFCEACKTNTCSQHE